MKRHNGQDVGGSTKLYRFDCAITWRDWTLETNNTTKLALNKWTTGKPNLTLVLWQKKMVETARRISPILGTTNSTLTMIKWSLFIKVCTLVTIEQVNQDKRKVCHCCHTELGWGKMRRQQENQHARRHADSRLMLRLSKPQSTPMWKPIKAGVLSANLKAMVAGQVKICKGQGLFRGSSSYDW